MADRRLVVELAETLHECGASSYDLEEFVVEYADQLGMTVDVFHTPTSLFLAFDKGDVSGVRMSRMEPREIRLGRLAEVCRMAAQLKDEQTHATAARDRLRKLRDKRDATPAWLSVVAYSAASATAAGFFGGGWRDVSLTAITGFVIGVLGELGARSRTRRRLLPPFCACAAALLAGAGSVLLTPASPDIVTLGSLIVLLPGLAITGAISELSHEHLVTGSARLVGALAQLMTIGFGAAVGTAIASQSLAVRNFEPIPLDSVSFAVCLLIAPLSFSVLFHARLSDTPWIFLSCLAAFGASRWGQTNLGTELGASIGGFALGVVGNTISRATVRPAPVLLVPGLLILVPGSVGFEATQAFVDRDTLQAAQSAFRTLFVAVALVSGLLVANLVVPPRRIRHGLT